MGYNDNAPKNNDNNDNDNAPKNMFRKRGDKQKLFFLLKSYKKYKSNYAWNLKFDPYQANSSRYKSKILSIKCSFLAGTFEYSPLQMVQIYFDTATFDEINRDKKMTLTGQIGLVGGTMGLLSGFSILSAVEIIYFATKFIFSRRTFRKNLRKD